MGIDVVHLDIHLRGINDFRQCIVAMGWRDTIQHAVFSKCAHLQRGYIISAYPIGYLACETDFGTYTQIRIERDVTFGCDGSVV